MHWPVPYVPACQHWHSCEAVCQGICFNAWCCGSHDKKQRKCDIRCSRECCIPTIDTTTAERQMIALKCSKWAARLGFRWQCSAFFCSCVNMQQHVSHQQCMLHTCLLRQLMMLQTWHWSCADESHLRWEHCLLHGSAAAQAKSVWCRAPELQMISSEDLERTQW